MSAVDSRRRKRVVRVMGIEPTPQAWEAHVLPLNYTRSFRGRVRISEAHPMQPKSLCPMPYAITCRSLENQEISGKKSLPPLLAGC